MINHPSVYLLSYLVLDSTRKRMLQLLKTSIIWLICTLDRKKYSSQKNITIDLARFFLPIVIYLFVMEGEGGQANRNNVLCIQVLKVLWIKLSERQRLTPFLWKKNQYTIVRTFLCSRQVPEWHFNLWLCDQLLSLVALNLWNWNLHYYCQVILYHWLMYQWDILGLGLMFNVWAILSWEPDVANLWAGG